ncbi:MAG: hypothetical protein NZM26_04820 [Patescibacteria group bacterium]|nr:hypothetical protein [Patescibacteria group bacterium]
MRFLYFVFLVSLLFLYLVTPRKLLAQSENFAVDINSVYEFFENKDANVTHQIFIENLDPNFTSKAYSLKLTGIDLKSVKAYEGKNELAITVFERDGANEIMIYFTEVVAGKGRKREVILTYQSDSYLSKFGDVWDLYIPYLEGNPKTRNTNVTLIIPSEVAKEAYITPHAYEKSVNSTNAIFSFTKNTALGKPIRAIYGNSQTYEVELNFVLENDNFFFPEKKSIALPPDTNRQKVALVSISQDPSEAFIDNDGNWIYVYEVAPRSVKKINAKLRIQVFSESLRSENFAFPPVDMLANLAHTKYWNSNDVEIQKLAKDLKTPEKIYKYVVETLEYNQNETSSTRIRKGAKGALADPKNSICTEYTDLFITLARAAGIPAREVVGYGYSDYRDKQPLSLVADVLHSWPEYWDESKQKWIAVDPTWEDTSRQNYFDEFDTRHITFVIHGKNEVDPQPPGMYTAKGDSYLSKQVFVSLVKPVEIPDSRLDISYSKNFMPNLFKRRYVVKVKNEGSEAVYQTSLNISGGIDKEVLINSILPSSIYEFSFEVDYGLFGFKKPPATTISLADESVEVIHSVWDILIPFFVIIIAVFVLFTVFRFVFFFFPKRNLSKVY